MNTGKNTRNSDTDPLRIAELIVPGMPGLIGMTICPGKKGPSLHGGQWNRDFKTDMDFIRIIWRADVMVTLLEKHEFEMLGVEALKDLSSERLRPIQWIHIEITDGGIPDERFERQWLQVRALLITALSNGNRVLIHCRGGLGRTGLMAAQLLIETGMPADDAIKSVRAARKGAIETADQENYVRHLQPALPTALQHGLTLSLNEILKSESIAHDSLRARELALTVFSMILARWCAHPCQFHNPRLQAELLGIDEVALEQYWCSKESSLSADTIERIDILSRICLALPVLFGQGGRNEVLWLERMNQRNAPLLQLLINKSPLKFISINGIYGMKTVCDYLEEKVARLQENDRYLLCLGVCNTLFDTPNVSADMVSALTLQGVKNAWKEWQARIVAARDLPTAIPLGEHHVLLPRPHLQALIEYIRQHQNLDVAIISSATREHIDKYLGMAAPELLEMCQFVWSREDEPCYYKRRAGITLKTLENIPEFKGYRAGRILMVEHCDVLPQESHLRIWPFYGESFTEKDLQNENDLQDVIRRLSILTQVDDIISLRKNEAAELARHVEQVAAWSNQHNISPFDTDRNKKMESCPFKAPMPIDGIEVPGA